MTTTRDPRAAVRPPRRRARAAFAAVLAATGLVVLAGCMKVEMNFTLSEEDTVTGSMVMAISDEFAESLDMDPQEMWDMADEGEDGITSDLPEGSTQEPYADGEYTGVEVTYTDQPISAIGTNEDLSITREGDEFVIDGVMDLTDESTDAGEAGEMPAGLLESFIMRIAVTFPGAVGETNGTVDGNTVTWEPVFGETTEITARGSAVADGGAEDGATEPTDEATDGAGADEGTDTGSDDEATGGTADDSMDADATNTAETSDAGFPWWIVGLVLGLGVLGTVVALVVRNNRTPGPPASSDPQDVFRADAPPTVQPGQPPVDPYSSGPPGGPHDPTQGPR